MRSAAIALGLAGIAALAAIPVGLSAGDDDRSAEARAAVPADRGRWVALPSLPGARRRDIDGAQMAKVDGHVTVAVVDRASDAKAPSRALVYRWSGSAWEGPLGGALEVRRGQPIALLGGARPCVVAPAGRSVRMRCLAGGRWRTLGGRVFGIPRAGTVTAFGGAFSVAGRPYVVRSHLQHAHRPYPHSPGLVGRIQQSILTPQDDGWATSVDDLDAQASGGQQRPFGFALGTRPCVAYDRVSTDAPPVIAVRCAVDGAWQQAGIPDLTSAQVFGARDMSPEAHAVNVDGATALGGTVALGVDAFFGPHVDWPVWLLEGGVWRPSHLGGRSPEWDEQGSVHAIGDELWSVRFDQRSDSGRSGLRIRLIVQRRTPGGTVSQVGADLIGEQRLLGPLYWGLDVVAGQVYAMATVPEPAWGADDLRVFRLTGARASGAG